MWHFPSFDYTAVVFMSSAYTAAAIPSSAHTAAKQTNKQIRLLHLQRYKDRKKARTHFDYYFCISIFFFVLIDTATTFSITCCCEAFLSAVTVRPPLAKTAVSEAEADFVGM